MGSALAPSLKFKLGKFQYASIHLGQFQKQLRVKVREEITIGAASFKRCADMLSSPLALFEGRLSMILKISAQLAGLRIKVDLVGLI